MCVILKVWLNEVCYVELQFVQCDKVDAYNI